MVENARQKAPAEGPDFVNLRRRYESILTNGQRAELRRATSPDDLPFMPAYYQLIARRADLRWQRVAFLLPFASHKDSASSLGEQMAKAGVNQMRLFQVIRSQRPNDLNQLRRIVQQLEPKVDWNKLGPALFYWGDRSKRQIIEDFFLAKGGN